MKGLMKICLLALVISVAGIYATGCGKTIGPDSVDLPGGDGEDNSSNTSPETTEPPKPTENPKPTDVEQTQNELENNENSDSTSEISKKDLNIKIYGTEVSFDDTKIDYSFDKLKSAVDKVVETGGKVYLDYSYGDSDVSTSIEKDLKELDVDFTVIKY